MSSIEEKNKAIVARFSKEFIERGDMDVFEETFAADFVNHTAQEGQADDRASVAHFFNAVMRPAFPDLTVTIHDQVAEGDEVVTRKSYSGTHQGTFLGVPATGNAIEFAVIDILKLRNGQCVEHWARPDMVDLLDQLKSPSIPQNTASNSGHELGNRGRIAPAEAGVAAALPDTVKKCVDDAALFATFATISADGSPHLTRVWIKRDGDDILLSTTEGRQQGKNLRRDPRATVIIGDPDNPYRYVEIRGRALLTFDLDGRLPNELSLKYTGLDFNPPTADDGARLIVRIVPEKVTGAWR